MVWDTQVQMSTLTKQVVSIVCFFIPICYVITQYGYAFYCICYWTTQLIKKTVSCQWTNHPRFHNSIILKNTKSQLRPNLIALNGLSKNAKQGILKLPYVFHQLFLVLDKMVFHASTLQKIYAVVLTFLVLLTTIMYIFIIH